MEQKRPLWISIAITVAIIALFVLLYPQLRGVGAELYRFFQ